MLTERGKEWLFAIKGIMKLPSLRFSSNLVVVYSAPELCSLPSTSIGLLLDVVLSTALLRLADIVLPLVLRLLRAVARHAGDGVAERTRGAIRQARAEVLQLPAGLLLLALEVLLAAGLLEVLGAHQSADRLLSRPDGLVPRARGAVGVVLGDGAG